MSGHAPIVAFESPVVASGVVLHHLHARESVSADAVGPANGRTYLRSLSVEMFDGGGSPVDPTSDVELRITPTTREATLAGTRWLRTLTRQSAGKFYLAGVDWLATKVEPRTGSTCLHLSVEAAGAAVSCTLTAAYGG